MPFSFRVIATSWIWWHCNLFWNYCKILMLLCFHLSKQDGSICTTWWLPGHLIALLSQVMSPPVSSACLDKQLLSTLKTGEVPRFMPVLNLNQHLCWEKVWRRETRSIFPVELRESHHEFRYLKSWSQSCSATLIWSDEGYLSVAWDESWHLHHALESTRNIFSL